MEREELHRLVDGVPEGALEHVRKMLDHFQTWPPKVPPGLEEMRQRREEFRREVRQSGSTSGVGGGGGIGGGSRFGYRSFGYREEEASIRETRHFYEGIEIAAIERLSLGEDRKTIRYSISITGPDREQYKHELKFDLRNT